MTTALIEDNDDDIFHTLLNNNYCVSPFPFFFRPHTPPPPLSFFLYLSLWISLVKIVL